jgi:RNA polymerase sigma-70 factor (ECF subfamily)
MEFTVEHKKLVQSLVAGVLRRPWSDPDVEDCTGETFRRALESKGRLRPGEPVRPWLLGIARHVALDALRATYRARGREVNHSNFDAENSDPLGLVVDSGQNPELSVGERRATQLLAVRLAELPEEQQQAILLFHVEGLGYREIAERMSVPVGSVGTWILRARNALREAFKDENDGRSSGGQNGRG